MALGLCGGRHWVKALMVRKRDAIYRGFVAIGDDFPAPWSTP
jgi:hypothetical protein